MIIGYTKIRNEELILQDTLDHWGQFCDWIYVVDDDSTDSSVDICLDHPKVKGIYKVGYNKNRGMAESVNRKIALDFALQDNPDWLCCFDADERIYNFSLDDLKDCDAVSCKLFDVYITEEDKDKDWKERKYVGEEYREIPFFFKNRGLGYTHLDQRIPDYPEYFVVKDKGFIKHYGKGISVEQWEETCDYYASWNIGDYKEKWTARKGKAIHTESDFGGRLIKFSDILNGKEKGKPLC